MSDAASQSAKPAPTLAPKPERSEESNADKEDVFPFLVHSQDAVTNGDPPDVDNAKLARQKRKRTSPEDQALLEAEYKKNPKPDKFARMAIVERVSLGEKEVQIWFQNRRQNTRRKSRPLLPHEIAAFGLRGMAALSSEPNTPASANTSFNSSFASSQGESLPPSSQNEPKPQSPSEETLPSSSPKFKEPTTISLETPAPDRTINIGSMGMEAPLPTITPLKPSMGFQETFANSVLVHDTSKSQPTPGYLANRWNMSSICGTPETSRQAAKFMTPHTNQAPSFMTPSQVEPELPCPPLDFNQATSHPTPKSTSNIRLSLSLDGHASLVSADQSSSPPRAMPPRPTSGLSNRRPAPLQRSLSAAAVPFSLSRQPSIGSLSQSGNGAPPRLPIGRSRDAKTWEFCADSDARDELTLQAENESSGSAVAAISLIRSTSVKTSERALKPNNNKRNAPAERAKPGSGKRAMLKKNASALGRMQADKVALRDNTLHVRQPLADNVATLKKGAGARQVLSPTDSDKENWLPGDLRSQREGSVQRRPLPDYRPKTVPRSSPSKPQSSARSGSTPNAGRQRVRNGKKPETKVFEDGAEDDAEERRQKETSEEVERFMMGAAVSPSKKGDLDCIQGLLSLSQGNWR